MRAWIFIRWLREKLFARKKKGRNECEITRGRDAAEKMTSDTIDTALEGIMMVPQR